MAMGREPRDDDDPKWRPALVKKPMAPLAEVSRTTRGLRDALFDEIDAIRNGGGDPQRAMAVSKLAGQIINVAKAEMEFYKLAKDEGPQDLVERATVTALPPKAKTGE